MMEIISRKGIIIKEVKVGEGNKIFTILTSQGTLSASAMFKRRIREQLCLKAQGGLLRDVPT